MEKKMEERNWKYKITGNWTAIIAVAITTAVFGGVTFWLYTAHNGGYIVFGGMTAIFAIVWGRAAFIFGAHREMAGTTATARFAACGLPPME